MVRLVKPEFGVRNGKLVPENGERFQNEENAFYCGQESRGQR